jgi:hypothetical protein
MVPFGTTFSRLAFAPLEASGGALNDARMGEGIRLLERAALEQALQRGVEAVAQEAGVPAPQVAALVPQEEIQGALERLQKRQERAVQVVRRQEMTVATFAMPSELPTEPSASEQLTSLAAVFARDKEMATKLRDLSFEVAAWEALLRRVVARLDEDAGLQQSLRQRRLRRALVTWGSLGVVLLVVLGGGAYLALEAQRAQQEKQRLEQERARAEEKRRRVEAALGRPDPCEATGLSAEEEGALEGEAKQRLAARAQRCGEQRARQQQEKQCGELVARLEAGRLGAEDGALAGPAEPTLRRLATRALTPADLDLDPKSMPCASVAAGSKLWAALARGAAAGGPNLWGLAEGVSPGLREPLLAPGVLHPSTVLAIAFRSEKLATAALRSGRPEDTARARSMCELKSKLGQALALSCQKILK